MRYRTNQIGIGLIIAGLLVSNVAAAQEELPTPRPAPAPAGPPPRAPLRRPLTDAQRAERRERLLNIGGQVLNAVVPPDPNAPGAAAAIDIPKLNTAMGPLLTTLLGGGRDIESLRIGFDPEGTNFAEDHIRLSVDAALRRTNWAEVPSRLSGSLGAQVVQNDAGGLVAVVDGRFRLQTPVVALANYALAQYKQRQSKKSDDAPPAPAGAQTPEYVFAFATTETTDEIFGRLLDERLARIDHFETLDDVADLLTAISGLRLTAADLRIEQLRDQARAAKDPAVRDDLNSQLTETRAQRDKLFDVRPRISRRPNGAVEMIGLDMVGSEIYPGADMRQLECRIQENEITLQASGALTRWVEIYPLAKPLVMGVLQRIQNGDPRALDAVRPFIEGPLGRGRAIIIGEP
ncbi:MAG TPA: hypothetical protein VGN12_13170 [Pirellulales bacterium]